MTAKPLLLVIAGPTASGKTEIAIALAKKISCEIISCDSMQVYKSMSIVTQAPPVSSKIHLVSFLDPTKEYSAAQFRKDAQKKIHEILKKKKIPIITAGTGLYLRALLDGLFELPGKLGSKDGSLRQALNKEAEVKGSEALHQKLKEVDPKGASKIHPNDLRRIIRALEVFELTGKPISEHQPNRKGIRSEFKVKEIFLDRDRASLYSRIDSRVDRMMKDGMLEEVQGLLNKKLSLTAGMALGIRQIKQFLEGKMSMAAVGDLIKRDTRHYAKRQLSWFRHEKEMLPLAVKPEDSPADIAEKIIKTLKRGSK